MNLRTRNLCAVSVTKALFYLFQEQEEDAARRRFEQEQRVQLLQRQREYVHGSFPFWELALCVLRICCLTWLWNTTLRLVPLEPSIPLQLH